MPTPFIFRASWSFFSRFLRHAWQGSGSILSPNHRVVIFFSETVVVSLVRQLAVLFVFRSVTAFSKFLLLLVVVFAHLTASLFLRIVVLRFLLLLVLFLLFLLLLLLFVFIASSSSLSTSSSSTSSSSLPSFHEYLPSPSF